MPFLLFLGNALQAEEVSLEHQQALVQKIDAINQNLEAGEIRLLVDALPPRFYQEMAALLQRNIKELQDDFAASLQQKFDGDGMNTYRFDSDAISYHETKAGGIYAFVPTRVEMQGTIHKFQTLAIYDEGWYLIHGGQKAVQNPVFLEIYPFFAEITIPPNNITKIDN